MGKQVGENSLDHSYPSGFGNCLYGFILDGALGYYIETVDIIKYIFVQLKFYQS